MRNSYVTLALAAVLLPGIALAGPGHDHGKSAKKLKPLPNCPIMDEPINLAVSTATDDGPVFFCCEGCVKKFGKNPAKYASKVSEQRAALADRPKVQTTCPVTGEPVDQKVSIDAGGKKVFFCCQGCSSKYKSDPRKYSSALANSYTFQATCPVMGHAIDPASFTKLADGRKIYYCCPGCDSKLFEKPAKYAKHLASQGYQYNWAKIKKADDKEKGGHEHHNGHDHGHGGHDHD